MTIVLSIATASIITVTVDSAVTKEFQNHREYDTAQKAWRFPGVGCVATWGTLTGNKIGDLLQSRRITPEKYTVDSLADLVDDYLRKQYMPRKEPLDDIGYHVAGFNQQGKPRLHHVVWGIRRPAPATGPNPRQYHWSHHDPDPEQQVFVYNGRNDLAETVITHMLDELNRGWETRFNLSDAIDQIRFADFVIRFAAELTPQVGPPFHTFVIAPQNDIGQMTNSGIRPIESAEVKRVVEKLGLS